jgi:hypothetical protein
MMAVDVAVVGLQKRLISAKVLRVGGREFSGPGMLGIRQIVNLDWYGNKSDMTQE